MNRTTNTLLHDATLPQTRAGPLRVQASCKTFLAALSS